MCIKRVDEILAKVSIPCEHIFLVLPSSLAQAWLCRGCKPCIQLLVYTKCASISSCVFTFAIIHDRTFFFFPPTQRSFHQSFLDFIGEPEQFYWFIEHYLSVPFSIPKNLKDKKEHNLSSCANRSWVSEFLRSYEEPDIKELMKYLDKEQKVYFSYTFENIEPVPKYTSFALKEFHKYCILPPLVETSIKQKDQDGMLSFQLNQDEYKIYLSSIGSPISALKKLYQSMEDGERKNSLKNILDNERSNDVFINCPVYNLKLHYHKECDSQPNVLKCLDSYIKKLCERRIAGKEKGTFCDHLLFLFDALKSPYIDNFKKFLTRDDVHLVKPQSVWTLPLFTTYNPRDIKNPNSNIPVDIFKVLNSKNKMFLSFFDQAPKSPYYMEESQGLVKLSDFASSIFG